jgi:hypothetical protein
VLLVVVLRSRYLFLSAKGSGGEQPFSGSWQPLPSEETWAVEGGALLNELLKK